MKTRDMQLKVQAYLDNELSPADARKVGTWISSDPAARELYNELKNTREILTQNEPALTLPESRDFFWSKIERGIAFAERAPAAPEPRPWWVRFLAPVAGTVALFAVLFTLVDRGGGPAPMALSNSEITEGAPIHQFQEGQDVSTITFRSEAEGVTVVWLSTQ
jgi:anti-sigma factor RsiW